MDINRQIFERIEKDLFRGRIIVLYGPRRVGKTTLVNEVLGKYQNKYRTRYLLCDNISVQQGLNQQEAIRLKEYIGDVELLILDEAQKVKNIGINLKILIDTYPNMQIIATGSSSFELANKINEPLTGRIWEYFLPPLSLGEVWSNSKNRQDIFANLNNYINYGLYPDIFKADIPLKIRLLEEITKNYLYQDILAFEGIKNSDFLIKLLQLLAFQIGNEVSFNEIANKLEVSKSLVAKYIDLLEKTFVIFRLKPFSRNLRREVGKKSKIYFWDTGMRNALIRNFNDLDIRPDTGALWENFCISERYKYLKNNQMYKNSYFWRTADGKEIDYIEDEAGKLGGFEFKWSDKARYSIPKIFLETYENSTVEIITRSSLLKWIGIE